jgi:peptide chain release factor 1
MKPFMRSQLERYAQRLDELNFLLSREDIMKDMNQFMSLSKEHADVAAVAGPFTRWLQRIKDLEEAKAILAGEEKAVTNIDKADTQNGGIVSLSNTHSANDELDELQQMAQEEILACEQDIGQLEAQLQRMLLPKDPDDSRPAYLEIRAGTGGDESALFAADLLRMYTRFCERMGWRVEVMSASESELGGYREVVIRIEGAHVFGRLKYESGGHRVQRVPATETQGRIHTSMCTVAVLPEPDETLAVQINPSDLRIDTFRASGAGGQHINKTDSAVRITHLPTGIVAECQDDRSQHRNKARALQVLSARIQEKERSERAAKEAATRKGLIGSGDRSERIRTYNFPQGRLSDHRINLTLYKLTYIMEGDMEEVISALEQARQAEQLEELEVGGLYK